MNKNDSLRFKVSVSPAYADLYELLKDIGPYYRSRRMLQLALLGLSIENAGLVIATPAIAQTEKQTPSAREICKPAQTSSNEELIDPETKELGDPETNYYKIPNSAGEDIENLFNALQNS